MRADASQYADTSVQVDDIFGAEGAALNRAIIGTGSIGAMADRASEFLLNRQRFLRMLGEMHLRPYAEWPDFLDPLYVDQSHMIRDFQKFLGMSPSQYFALDRPILRAAAIGRAAALGSPLQGLHRPRA